MGSSRHVALSSVPWSPETSGHMSASRTGRSVGTFKHVKLQIWERFACLGAARGWHRRWARNSHTMAWRYRGKCPRDHGTPWPKAQVALDRSQTPSWHTDHDWHLNLLKGFKNNFKKYGARRKALSGTYRMLVTFCFFNPAMAAGVIIFVFVVTLLCMFTIGHESTAPLCDGENEHDSLCLRGVTVLLVLNTLVSSFPPDPRGQKPWLTCRGHRHRNAFTEKDRLLLPDTRID